VPTGEKIEHIESNVVPRPVVSTTGIA
jgi:hypothetical protein